MAKSKKKSTDTPGEASTSSTAGAVADSTASTYEEDELELLQVDLGDMVKMKQVLDETVTASVLETVKEDYRWDNFKLSLMAGACVFAMIAQFAPIPFPESRPILGVCGSLYFILSGILQFITTFIDKDAILLTKPEEKHSSADMVKYGLRVRTSLPRFSEWFTVIVEFRKPKEEGPSPFCEQRWSVGQFFDKEGYFDEIGLMEEVDKVVKRFAAKKYDTATDEKKKQ